MCAFYWKFCCSKFVKTFIQNRNIHIRFFFCHCWQDIFIYKLLLGFYPHNCFFSLVVDHYERFTLKSHFTFKFRYLCVQFPKLLYSFILFFILIQTAEFSKVSLNLTNVITDSQNAINLDWKLFICKTFYWHKLFSFL